MLSLAACTNQQAAARRQGVRAAGDAQVSERSANETSCAVTPRATLARHRDRLATLLLLRAIPSPTPRARSAKHIQPKPTKTFWGGVFTGPIGPAAARPQASEDGVPGRQPRLFWLIGIVAWNDRALGWKQEWRARASHSSTRHANNQNSRGW